METVLDPLAVAAAAPADVGVLRLLVLRPSPGERLVVEAVELDADAGVVGDGWRARGSRHTEDGAAEPERQVTLANHAVLVALAGGEERVPLAGDQLYVDLDLSPANLPAGTRLVLGTAELEVTAAPHTGCAKFADRFGMAAARLANSEEGRRWSLRGINARVVTGGTVRVGDTVTKRG